MLRLAELSVSGTKTSRGSLLQDDASQEQINRMKTREGMEFTYCFAGVTRTTRSGVRM